ncbi:hypothetical protein E8E12_005056 [Didymella heteroderae]|uniref:Caspase domain-containing protein n=1 Tax=Didymella heteroderae TaxID=1769908 RepID=A0A9P5C060_9PLEO|nr:hypothetical protein E8E12_005056 [Didymella heteroderae]
MGTQQPHHETVPFTATGEAHLGVLTGADLSRNLCDDESCAVSPTDDEKKEETQRQAWFENAVKKKLNIPNSYIQVAPLIIRWSPEIDDYDDGHTSEIAQLKTVFGRFGFKNSSEVQLNANMPQHTLNAAIANHIAENDGPNKLIIIYYTGHGILGEDDYLQFAAEDDLNGKATAYWYKAELPLLDSESMRADVLAIFDCCYASNVKGCQDSRRLYDLLAACPEGKPAKAPGKGSFSQRLINTLNEMLDEDPDQRILTTRIMDDMNKECRFPIKLHDRLHKGKSDGRHVQLVRINDGSKKKTQNAAKRFQKRAREEARVTLRFSLYESQLSQGQIEKWAGHLVTASNSTKASIPLRQIEWVRMEKSPGGRWRDAIGTVIKNHPAQRFRDTTHGNELTSNQRPQELSDKPKDFI